MKSLIEEVEIINKYLCDIKKNLPLWLRIRRDELNNILDEIEEHIWEKAIEIADNKTPNDIDIQIAISQMGDPQDIANKFVIESTPYVYISEELYPFYKKYRKTFVWSFLIWLTIFIVPNPFAPIFYFRISQLSLLFFETIISVLAILMTLFIFIGIVFCYLSISGYLPFELRNPDLSKVGSLNNLFKKPSFYSVHHIIIVILEISFIIVIGIFLIFDHSNFNLIIFFLIIIVKCSRELIKRTSIIWQKSLILFDIILMGGITRMFGDILFISNNYEPSDVSYYLSTAFFIYVCYEVYVYITYRDRVEFYLKKVSLIKRINKKQRMLINVSKNDIAYSQNNMSDNFKYSHDFEKKIRLNLKKIRKELPILLKLSKKQSIVKDIEIEIRETLLEIKDPNNLTEEDLKKVVANLGSIESRILEYKQERTPKIYISKELWAWYLKGIKAVITYFILISLYILVLQLSFNASINFNSVFVYFSIIWLTFISIIILTTKTFTFFSLNDLIPRNSEINSSSKIKTVKDSIFYIWEFFFTTFYIIIGSVLLYYEFIPLEFNLNRTFILIWLSSNLFLFLGITKAFKIIFKGKKIKLILIILCLALSLLISFLDLYNYHLNYRFINSSLSLRIFELVFIPINIEIVYEIFHYFFRFKIKT